MNSPSTLDVLFTPADFDALSRRDLTGATCVVFDVLRATSSMITALAHGAKAIIPVAEIPEALELHRRRPECLLAGERDGLRISSELTGSIPFHLGNSPREFLPEVVRGRTIAMTTTNGTRALRACHGADRVYVSSFLNLTCTSGAILSAAPANLILVCSGTFEEAAYEDILGAGALCEMVWEHYSRGKTTDAAFVALRAYQAAKTRLIDALADARNGKRLLSRPELAADVEFCANKDSKPILATMAQDGSVILTADGACAPSES